MELHNRNQSEQLPYEKLALLGIDREKADNLPQEVKERLVSGEVTPLMQVSISARNGDVITLPLKLQMTADKDGNPALLAYPVRAELETERNKVLRLTPQEAERLAKGEVLQKAVEVNGEKTQQYLQLDPETKSVIHRRVTDIEMERKLKDMEKVNGHAAEAAGTGRQARGAERGRREGLRGHRSQRATGGQAHQGRHEGMGKAAEAPLRRPAPRIPRPRDDRQEPLGISESGGHTIQRTCFQAEPSSRTETG